jgi:hypothetical protein
LKQQPPALEKEAIAAAKKSDGYREAKAKAGADAKAQKAKLEEKPVVRVYTGAKKSVALVDLEIYTGEGNNMCGAEDVRVDLRGMFEVEGEHVGRAIVPMRAIETSEVDGVLDVGGDGHVELLQKSFPDNREVISENGDVACSIAIEFCDCGC